MAPPSNAQQHGKELKSVIKKILIIAITVMLGLHAWVSAERHAGPVNMYLVTSFDFSQYPACSAGRTSYCIQAIRFYDPDSNLRLAEAAVPADVRSPRTVVASVRVHSIPLHAYAITVYRDGSGNLKEGAPGRVSTLRP